MQARRHADVGQDVLALADQIVVDPHARIIDVRMHDAVRIGLWRPDIIIDRLGVGLARGIELEDGDDLARLRSFDQVVIVKSPGCRDVGAEAASGMAGVAARARPNVEDANFQDIAGLGVLDRDGPGQKMDADAFAGAALERTLGRTRAAGEPLLYVPWSSETRSPPRDRWRSSVRNRRWRGGSAFRSWRGRLISASAPAPTSC